MITKKDLTRIKHYSSHYKTWLVLPSLLYGRKRALYDIIKIPYWLPLNAYLEHGANPAYSEMRLKLTAKSIYPFFLLNSNEHIRLLKKYTHKKVYSIGDVYARFRRKFITKNPNSLGTLYFPHHSTRLINVHQDHQRICYELKRLPKVFKPITICLYWVEVVKGIHKIYEENGFNVITNGHLYDDSFITRFYDNMKNYSYCSSNVTGSYAYYAVEMEIPFFIYGPEVEYYSNEKSHVVERGEKVEYEGSIQQLAYQKKNELFWYDDLEEVHITDEQKEYVLGALGLNEEFNESEIRRLIYWNSILYPITLLRYYVNKIKNKFF